MAALRAEIAGAEPDAALAQSWLAQWNSQLKGQGVFVRSSSNSEDLPGFSGAGLYTTVPNVTQAEALARVQTVWASVYNFEAYEARRAAGQDAVAMAVLVQLAAPSDSSGVMITRDPFDAGRRHVTHLGQARPGHQGGGRQAPGRAGDVFELVQGGAGAEPLGRGHAAGARRRRRRARCRCKARARY